MISVDASLLWVVAGLAVLIFLAGFAVIVVKAI